MIGWSRRSAESSQRRSEWWDSLTEEEKELETRRGAVEDRWFWYTFGGTFAVLVLFWLALPHELFERSPVVRFLFMITFPLCLTVGALVATHKKKQVR